MKNLKIGIYSITNTTNDKVYVGSSKNIYRRWSEHRRGLNNQKHCNKHLQYAWNKYGAKSFKFKILEECELERIYFIERQYIEDLGAMDSEYGYNQELPNTDNNPKVKKEMSKESKYKIGLYRFKGTEEEYQKVLSGELVRYRKELVTQEKRDRLMVINMQAIKVYQLTLSGEIIKIHKSYSACAKYMNATAKSVCTHMNKSGKYKFKDSIVITEDQYNNELELIINFKKFSKYTRPRKKSVFKPTHIIWKYNLKGELVSKFNTVKAAAQEIGSNKAQEMISRSILHGKAYHKHQYTRTRV